MSWKACAYVKELRHGLSVTEKFVLLMLAEYHRTDQKNAWPSVATLADDCLMTTRGVQQILVRLEENDFIRRQIGGGRGNVTAYQIVGIDVVKGEQQTANSHSVNVDSANETLHSHAVNPAQPCNAIRNEPVLETNRLKPSDIGIDGATSKAFLELGLGGTQARMRCQDVIRAYVHLYKCSFADASDGLILRWNQYSASAIPYKKGIVKFLEEGIWKNPDAWLQKPKLINAADEARRQLLEQRAHAAGN